MMKIEPEVVIRLRKELAEFSRRAFHRGLVSGTGGNISVRIPNTDQVLITPSGVSLGDVEPEANLLVNLEGTVIDNPCGLIPSKETSFHLVVYQLRPDAGAIAHVHPPYATAYSNKEKTPSPGDGFEPCDSEGGSLDRMRNPRLEGALRFCPWRDQKTPYDQGHADEGARDPDAGSRSEDGLLSR